MGPSTPSESRSKAKKIKEQAKNQRINDKTLKSKEKIIRCL